MDQIIYLLFIKTVIVCDIVVKCVLIFRFHRFHFSLMISLNDFVIYQVSIAFSKLASCALGGFIASFY